MSVNWTKGQLAARLRKDLVAIESIVVGDIAFNDGNPYGVARVDDDTTQDTVWLFDEDNNGFGAPRGTEMWIVAREALKPLPKKRST